MWGCHSVDRPHLTPSAKQNFLDWVIYKQQKSIAHNSGGWKARIKSPADLPAAEMDSLLNRWRLLAVSLHGRRGPEVLLGLSYKGTNSILKMPPPKVATLGTVALGIGFQHTDFGRTQTFSIALG